MLSLADGFLIPCAPDLFSVYGIRNIGAALRIWKKQFESIFHFLSDEKRQNFPNSFVKFLGYTIYNAKKYTNHGSGLNLAKAHRNYAEQIPETIKRFIEPANIVDFPTILEKSIGDTAVIHTHNTLPGMSQKYHSPMWLLPDSASLDKDDKQDDFR